jgi:hypothetical protein
LLIAVLALALSVPLVAFTVVYLLTAGASAVTLTATALVTAGGTIVSARVASRRASMKLEATSTKIGSATH